MSEQKPERLDSDYTRLEAENAELRGERTAYEELAQRGEESSLHAARQVAIREETIASLRAEVARLMRANRRARGGTIRATVPLFRQIRELRAWKADIEEAHRSTMNEPCESDDQQHCTCVPALRREIAALRAELEAANAARHEAMDALMDCQRDYNREAKAAREVRAAYLKLYEGAVQTRYFLSVEPDSAILDLARSESKGGE